MNLSRKDLSGSAASRDSAYSRVVALLGNGWKSVSTSFGLSSLDVGAADIAIFEVCLSHTHNVCVSQYRILVKQIN